MEAHTSVAEWLEETIAHARAKRYEDALACSERALALDGENAQALLLKGELLFVLGRHDEAKSSFERVLSLEPQNATAHKFSGRVAFAQGRYDEALKCYEHAYAIEPRDTDLAQRRASVLLQLKRYEEAMAACDQALELDPTHVATLLLKSAALTGLARYEDALAVNEQTLAIAPDQPQAWLIEATSLKMLKRYDSALEAYDRAIALDPNKDTLWNKALLLNTLGRHTESLSLYERVLVLDPKDYRIWNNKASNLVDLGRHDEAVAAFDQALGLDSGHAFIWRGKASALRALKRHEEAVDCLRRAVTLDPQDVGAWQNMGSSLEALDKYDEASAAYEEAIGVAPADVHGWLGKSTVLFRLERYEESLAAADEALRLSPSNPDVIAHHTQVRRNVHRSVPDQRLRLPDGRWLGYVDFGDPDGTPVIGCHGTPGSRLDDCWYEDELKACHIRFIVPDRPGYGQSDPKPRYRILDFCDDVVALADHLGLERFAVLSVSGGGPYALACAYKLATRVTRVALVSSPSPRTLRRVLRGTAGRNTIAHFVWRYVPSPILHLIMVGISRFALSHLRTVAEVIDQQHPPVDRRADVKFAPTPAVLEFTAESFRYKGAGFARDNYLLARPWGFRLEDISTEVYLWQGEADTFATPQDGRFLAAAIPHCHATFLPGEGHRAFEHHAEEILKTLCADNHTGRSST